MIVNKPETIIQEFQDHIGHQDYPCVAARAAVARAQIPCIVAGDMACPNDDPAIITFLYRFVIDFRRVSPAFHSAAVIFRGPVIRNEDLFDSLLWQRLQALSRLDARFFGYDKRVKADPAMPEFSFSLGEEAFFIIGMHPKSSRASRRFTYPALVFNPHAQFEELRKTSRYENMKHIVRKRDIKYSGSVNPMLSDFGQLSEVYQYSGRQYDPSWKCPLKINHADTENHTPEE